MENKDYGCDSKIESTDNSFEVVKIKKTNKVCPMCEDFSNKKIQDETPIAILSCEGACLRGEVSRQAANLLCYKLIPEKTSRICLGGAFTKDSGQRNLVKHSKRVIALEGCFIECASRMMAGVIEDFKPEVIIVDKLYIFDRNLFSINDMTEEEIKQHAETAADRIIKKMNLNTQISY